MSNHDRRSTLPNIPWWAIIAGFIIASPIGLGLLVLKILQESRPRPERWGQTNAASPHRAVYVQADKSGRKVSVASQQKASEQKPVHKLPKYPLVKLKEGHAAFWAGLATAFIFGIGSVSIFLDWGPRYLDIALSEAIPSIAFALAGVGAMLWGRFKTRRTRKYKGYLARLGNEPLVPLRPLAESIPASMDEVCETLQQMIDLGVFGDRAYLDLSAEVLVLDSSMARPAQKAKPTEKKPADLSSDEAILREIRYANDRIPDEIISRKIDRIEEITRHILNYLKKHPERSGELHTFLDYYLPTTLKMLNTYAELDAQQIGTDNISATKQRIEGILDKVVEGFETQLDKLFEGDMLDISSDIDVMEKMLQRDGLAGDLKMPKVPEQTAASASAVYTPTLTLTPEQQTWPR